MNDGIALIQPALNRTVATPIAARKPVAQSTLVPLRNRCPHPESEELRLRIFCG